VKKGSLSHIDPAIKQRVAESQGKLSSAMCSQGESESTVTGPRTAGASAARP